MTAVVRVPLRQQLSTSECGAACLAMVLSYFGAHCSVQSCREQLDPGRDGLSALAIARAARERGLRVKAWSVEPAALAGLRMPAVVHWRFNHFVVLERWTERGVVIADPASGRRRLSPEEFAEAFTGVALTFEPGPDFRRAADPDRGRRVDYVRRMARTPGARAALGQVLAASALLTAFGLAVPALTLVLVDGVIGVRSTAPLVVLGLAALTVGAAQLVGGYLRAVLVLQLRTRLDARMMLEFFEHVLSLPYSFFQRRSSGDLLMRLGSNVTIREMLTVQTVTLVLDGTLALAYAAILVLAVPLLGAVALGLGAVQLALVLALSRRVRDLTQRDLAAQATSQGYLVEALSGMETLKAAGAEQRVLHHWRGLFVAQQSASLRRSHLESVLTVVTGALRTVAPILLLLVGAASLLRGELTLGALLAFQAIAVQFLAPLSSLVVATQQLQVAGAHLERIVDVADARPEQDGIATRGVPRLTGRIELQGVGFAYHRGSPPALRDIDVTIEAGQKVALVGRTGSGKSTFAKLLLALHGPTAGTIRYDGLPVEQLDHRELRAQFGTVLQDPTVFSGSLYDNIAFGDPALDLAQVRRAAALAALDRDVRRMPMGYDTLIAEGGSALSGGQRQRLALARALVRQPALLVLDEATSHLDAVTEAEVSRNVSALSCTQVVVAHRLSTIRDADLILVLEDGAIVERGRHEELLAADGRYAALVHQQLAEPRPLQVTGGGGVAERTA